MAKISRIFKLNKTQRELDFVDIDPRKDTPVYLNPFVFSARTDRFSTDASRTVESFFQHAVDLIRSGDVEAARKNFSHLNEPNETCLGVSQGKPSGRGVGNDNAEDLFRSVLQSKAVKTGIVEHLEDTAIFIPGIGRDKVSDMTTNIIRRHLVIYTQNQCDLHGIPLTENVPTGFYWNPANKRWEQSHERMLVVEGRKILLVPKGVVSWVKEFTHEKYHRHFALVFLQEDHLNRGTRLVQKAYHKDGSLRRAWVTKKDLIEEELTADKSELLEFTARHPKIFSDFRARSIKDAEALPNSAFEKIDESQLIDHLIAKLKEIQPGNAGAGRYHTLMVGVLEFIFYPSLINPVKEREIHSGRKRIDILFDNGAPGEGFFHRLQHAMRIPCPYIPIECKNYATDISNPELDQMIGRLSPNRGSFGIIVSRELEDAKKFLDRCRDAYKDQHGLIIPLTDRDLITILEQKRRGVERPEDTILSDRARDVVAG
jgi:hypothetical protein